jgi:hypothetical protein
MISKKKKLPLVLAAVAAVPFLLVPPPALADDPVVHDTPAGRFVRRVDPDRTTLELPCGVVVVRARDRLQATREGLSLLDLRHERTVAGAGGRVALTRRGGQETAFVHDDDGLLTGVFGASRTFVEYESGLRTAFERDGEAEVWTRGDDGRLVAAGERRVRHDEAGRVVEVTGPPGDVGPTWRVRYVRDGRGRLTALEREDREGRLTRVRARRAPAVESLGPGRARTWLRLPGEPAPVAYLEDGAWTYLVADAQGSALLYLDAAGAPVGEADFSPWGEAAPGDRPLIWRGGRVVDREHLAWRAGRAWSPSLGQHLEPPYGLEPEGEGLAGHVDGH